MYKIIFFDLDGTLLTDEKRILDENKIAIKKAKENGIEVVLCSGRQKSMVEPYKNEAETGRYIICSNGAEIYDYEEKEELFTCEVDKNFALNLYNLANERKMLIRVDTPYARYINDKKYFLMNEIELYEKPEEFFSKNKILQLTLGMKSGSEYEEMISSLEKIPYVKIENRYCINFKNEPLWLINIVNTTSSKGNAISGLCKYLKISVEDAIAFGDDLNDISMMKTVGLGVAMENSHSQVKELAKKVIGSNNKPSISEFIYDVINKN